MTTTTDRAPDPAAGAVEPDELDPPSSWLHDWHDDDVTVRVGSLALVLPRRATLVTVVLVVVAVVVGVVSLAVGDYPVSLGGVARAIFDPDDSFATTIVRQWRASRTTAALMFGAALGLSGAVFQTLTRNPLGSPEIIGFGTGSYTGAIVVLTVLGVSNASVMVGALIGGLITAFVVYGLAYRNGVEGFRLIVVGIAVTALLQSLNVWLLLRAQEEVAMTATIWGSGSLSTVDWDELRIPAVALALLVVAMGLLSGPLRQLELGDDAANAHGVHAERNRLALIVVGVGFIAVVTAVAGPIAFVALAAPQIAKALAGSAGIPLVAAAATGSVILVAADFASQRLATDMTVGLVTLIFGGAYLLLVLVHASIRKL